MSCSASIFYFCHEKLPVEHQLHDKTVIYRHTIAMEKIKSLLSHYFNNRDEWLYFALVLVFSLSQLEQPLWSQYLIDVVINSAYLAPLILFKFWQAKLTVKLANFPYQLLRSLCFIVYPLVMLFGLGASFEIDKINDSVIDKVAFNSPAVIVLSGVAVELLLYLSRYISDKHSFSLTIKKIGLNELILFFLVLISVYGALLISSDLPLWYSSNSIQMTIDFSAIASHLLLTVGLAVQLFALFFCGYIFYWLNYHVLVKSVLAKRGLLIYLCAAIATVVLLYPIIIELFLMLPINYMAEPIIPAVNADAFDWHNGRVFLAVMLLSVPVILVNQWHKKSNQFALLEKEKVQTELQLLKQQIDPHFFFNTLNNLYALCRKKSEQAPEVVLQLAELMQYVVYRGQERSVLINEEVSYIRDYINLQSIRLGNKLSLEFTVDLDEPQSVISPLLLIILVENAFKHGIEPATHTCRLAITIQVKEQQLSFTCVNSIAEHDIAIDVVHEGVGLTNLKRRLALIYPNNYQLTLTPQADLFTAKLCINLSAATYDTQPEPANE